MKLVSTIGAILLVLGFLTSALGAFPLADISASGPEVTEQTPFSREVVETTAGQIGSIYTTVIGDLVTFAGNPDLALAQGRLGQMTTFAEGLASQFQPFADDLQVRLDATTAAPAAPTNVVAIAADGQVTLDWSDNAETDIDFYSVYRATVQGGPYSWYGAVTTSGAVDNGVTNGTTYYYVVTAVNTSNAESAASNEASATPQP